MKATALAGDGDVRSSGRNHKPSSPWGRGRRGWLPQAWGG